MSYQREMSRDHKGCVLFLLDQSYSMVEPLGGSGQRKCDQLAQAVNAWLHNMAIRAAGDSGIRDWLDIGVIGYRTDDKAQPIIEPVLQGPLAGRKLVSITDIGNQPARIETVTQRIEDEETGEIIEAPLDNPVWIDPIAEGSTPMCHVLHEAHQLISAWIAEHPDSFPPMVVHITAGESQDSDPRPYAEALRSLATSDGNLLLFNCHLSMEASTPFAFPSPGVQFPDSLAETLFEMSSELPPPFYQSALAEGMTLQSGARGMAFNADMVVLVKFLDMGTRPAMLLR